MNAATLIFLFSTLYSSGRGPDSLAGAFRFAESFPIHRPITFFRQEALRNQRGQSSLPSILFQTKSSSEEQIIKESLSKNVLFEHLPERSVFALVNAFEKINVSRGQVIVEQGDSCQDDYVYMVAEGVCTVTVDGTVVPDPYGKLRPPVMFGELGVLYNETRAATISAESESVTLFRVDGGTFKTILNKPIEYLDSMQEIDNIINQIEGTKALYGGDIIVKYQPQRFWLWRQFDGTILNLSLRTTFFNMLSCLLFIVYAKDATGEPIWTFQQIAPDDSLPFIQHLDLIHEIWGYQKGLTTFVLTFFLNEAYGFWKSVYYICRNIQDKLQDHQLLLVTNVARNDDGTITPESQKLLDDMGQYSRLFHILLWASAAERFSVLNTPRGLDRLTSRGLMTKKQLNVLQSLDVPSDQLHNAPLEWMIIRMNMAMKNGTLAGDTATKGILLRQISSLRSAYSTLYDKLDGRMPLAYAHFVQILVDTFVLLAPFALYSDLGDYAIFAVGLITLFYAGLLDLAKIFLDPLNNESFCENSIFMDLGVLIRQSNGDSISWKNAGARVPF